MDLDELIAELSADGADTAEILARLSDEELETLAADIVARFNELRGDAEHDDEVLAQVEALADVHRTVSEEAAARDAANTERASRLEELAAQLGTESGDDDGGDDEPACESASEVGEETVHRGSPSRSSQSR